MKLIVGGWLLVKARHQIKLFGTFYNGLVSVCPIRLELSAGGGESALNEKTASASGGGRL